MTAGGPGCDEPRTPAQQRLRGGEGKKRDAVALPECLLGAAVSLSPGVLPIQHCQARAHTAPHNPRDLRTICLAIL